MKIKKKVEIDTIEYQEIYGVFLRIFSAIAAWETAN